MHSNSISKYQSNHITEEHKKNLSVVIGKQISLIRRSKRMAGKELGDLIGISQQQISRYERGICRLDVATLIIIMNVLRVSIDEFFHNISLMLKNEYPETYSECHLPFSPVVTMTREQYVLMKRGHYIG